MRTKLVAGLAAAVSMSLLAAAGATQADTHWLVNGLFDDGGALSGSFDIDQYGYISGASLKVSGGGFADFTYTLNNSSASSGTIPPPDYNTYVAPYFIDLQPGYQADLHLEFANGLITPMVNNAILGGAHGPSYECVNSYSCYLADGDVRHFASGSASVGGAGAPEPAAWALMIAGFGLACASLRGARRKAAVVA